MNEEELQRDILFQIDMQLYDKYNKTIAGMNDHLGDIYTYRDIEEVEKAEREEKIDLLTKAIKELQEEIEELKKKNEPQPDCAEPVERTEKMVNMKWVNHNYISKDKIKELIEKYKTEKNNMTQIVFSKYGKTQQAYKQVVYANLIRVLEGLLSGQESDQEGGQEDE